MSAPSTSNSIPPTARVVTARVSPWLSAISYPLIRRFLFPLYFGKIVVSGAENIPRSGPLIVAPTHRSRWDALIVPCALGRPVTGRDFCFMVSANEMDGLQGWFIRRLGGFPVDPKHPSLQSVRHSVELLSRGRALVIFPEGNIFRDGNVRSLKPGPGRIALQAQTHQTEKGESVKIVPVGLSYSQAYPTWGCDVRVAVGKPLDTLDYSQGSTKHNAPHLMADLEAALRELNDASVLTQAMP
ncbi:1-acyl-sn-glycerol-3-phosphate acyltransferase [Rubidibacter lacunae KORDI 51-2]|uniref:1-acyl-sn-glycerol-3-phosphate acyltransferase n=1 Tax=Rubidibacter lacunae KORDI 51-2 TaxID=582515 RepID=U5DLE5_9CHRO|nr:lysophospholipid acyltransferase family protein [Rubidibacter lacunae]ERN41399.1 1-acyl-sn-glycerol-3-phosphate acyltransferase [Rubidibacter lacunae KORDI 51-2]